MFKHNEQVIVDRAIARNQWQIVSVDSEQGELAHTQPALPLACWLAKVSPGGTAPDSLPGVWLAPEDDPAILSTVLNGQLQKLPFIGIHFPRFVEGRGFSTAYLLRQRLGYTGELRAFGDLGRDHLWQLHRVGFNSFDLRAGTDLADALHAFADFPERYQASADSAEPLFRRRERELAHV